VASGQHLNRWWSEWRVDGQLIKEGGGSLGLVGLGFATWSIDGSGWFSILGWILIVGALAWGCRVAVERRDLASLTVILALCASVAVLASSKLMSAPSTHGEPLASSTPTRHGVATPTRRLSHTIETPVIPPIGTVDTGGVSANTNYSSVPATCTRSDVDHDRSGAYACRLPNGIDLDPCFDARPLFANPVCLTDPNFLFHRMDSASISLIGVKTELPEIDIRSDWKRPWFLRLANGQLCETPAFLDADTPIGAVYECFQPDYIGMIAKSVQSVGGWLFDYPDESERIWTVPFKARYTAQSPPHRMAVSQAWR
jgi:hypothetical protein